MIYLLLRKKVDEVEIDEVYIEEAAARPAGVAAPGRCPRRLPPTGGTSLPVVPPPPPVVVHVGQPAANVRRRPRRWATTLAGTPSRR